MMFQCNQTFSWVYKQSCIFIEFALMMIFLIQLGPIELCIEIEVRRRLSDGVPLPPYSTAFTLFY